MDPLDLLTGLHRDGERQGTGGDAETELALQLTDVGCAILSAEEHEIQRYETHGSHFGYGMSVARRSERPWLLGFTAPSSERENGSQKHDLSLV